VLEVPQHKHILTPLLQAFGTLTQFRRTIHQHRPRRSVIIGKCFVFPFHIGRFPGIARLDCQHANVFMREGLSRLRQRCGIHAQGQHHLLGADLTRVVDHDDEGLLGIDRLFQLINPQALKPVANGRPARDGLLDAEPLKEHPQRSDSPAKADRPGDIDAQRNHPCSIPMSPQRRIFRQVDGLPGLIPLSLGFHSPLLQGLHALLLLFELLPLLSHLRLEFVDPLVEFADFRVQRLSTPQQNRGDNADWGLEFLDLLVP
jgi:hypothetical protein